MVDVTTSAVAVVPREKQLADIIDRANEKLVASICEAIQIVMTALYANPRYRNSKDGTFDSEAARADFVANTRTAGMTVENLDAFLNDATNLCQNYGATKFKKAFPDSSPLKPSLDQIVVRATGTAVEAKPLTP